MMGRSALSPPTFRKPARANVEASPVYQRGSFVDGYASIAGAFASRAKRTAAARSAALIPCLRYPRRTKKQETDHTGRGSSGPSLLNPSR